MSKIFFGNMSLDCLVLWKWNPDYPKNELYTLAPVKYVQTTEVLRMSKMGCQQTEW